MQVRDLRMRYGDAEPVIDGLSLEVGDGQVVSLVGPSGSGKSTVLRAIAGLHPPDGGAVELGVAAAETGFLFQDDALLPWRTARQNVALGLKLHGRARGRGAGSRPTAGSTGSGSPASRAAIRGSSRGGQRKRVALAQVLALKPRLLLMDEPFASLDAIVRHHVTEDLLAWVERERIAVLLVTHDLEEAQAISDVVYLLSRGPRAHIAGRYPVAIPRPRDLIAARGHPSFAPLLARIWDDLSAEVGPLGDGGMSGLFERRWVRQALALTALILLWELLSRAGVIDPFYAPPPSTVAVTLYQLFAGGEILEAYRRDLHRGAARAGRRARHRRGARLRGGDDPAARRRARAGDDPPQRHPARDPGAALHHLVRHRHRLEGGALAGARRGAGVLLGLQRHPRGRHPPGRAREDARRRARHRSCARSTCPRSPPG